MSRASIILGGLASVGLTGCGVIYQVKRERPPPVQVPEQFSSATADAAEQMDTPTDQQWWRAFEDPELDALLAEAFAGNLDLELAYGRLRAAAAVGDASWAGYLPTIEGNGSVSYSRSYFNFGRSNSVTGSSDPISVEQAQTRIQLDLSYEVDLWGRVHNGIESVNAQLEATAADFAAAYMTVSANVVNTWLQAIEQRATLELLEQQKKANETYLELVELRFRQGIVTALDVFQQRQQVAALDAQIPPAKLQLAVSEHQLSVLLGKPPGEVKVTRTQLPKLPDVPEVGIPAQLLAQRPDVRSAQMTMIAADHDVGVAVASRFPTISLSGAAGFQGYDVAVGLFQNYLTNLAANLLVPLTDQVRLAAEEQQARAVLDQQIATYGSTVLTALQEVEDALVSEAHQTELVGELEAQLEVARATMEEAQRHYANGLSDYLPVLTALQTLQSTEQTLLSARRQVLSYRVELCRALGGSWMTELAPPTATSTEEAS